jgi:cell cycle sensor histidine kinase DivJ
LAEPPAPEFDTEQARRLAEIGHELRTPLNAILGFSDVLRERLFGPLDPRYGEYADLIHEAGRRLLDLVVDLQDLSRLEAGRLEPRIERLDARDPVLAALRLMRLQAQAAGVSLREALPADPLPAEVDPQALERIVLNLLSNALKFTSAGGQVTLTLATGAQGLELSVADTGAGISAQELERLGRPYEQGREEEARGRGVGLGLWLARGLAERHGGDLTILSAPGQGTSVRVRLPRVGPGDED